MASKENAAEIARLQRLIAARMGQQGYTANVPALKVRLAELQANSG